MTFNNWRIFKKLGYSEKRFLKLAKDVSRENSRTPVQWSEAENAGFTTGKPWFNINPNYKEINVEDDLKNPDSILNFYKNLIRLRKRKMKSSYTENIRSTIISILSFIPMKEFSKTKEFSLFAHLRKVLLNLKLLRVMIFQKESLFFQIIPITGLSTTGL